MNYKKFYEALENIKSGTCVRVIYTSYVPISSEFKDKCQDIKKTVSTTVRLGVQYNNIKSVKERQAANTAKAANKQNYKWLIKNRVKYNFNTGKTYLVMATFPKGDHTKVTYEFNNNGIISYCHSKEALKNSPVGQFIRKSYFSTTSHPVDIYNVNIENIVQIGKNRF